MKMTIIILGFYSIAFIFQLKKKLFALPQFIYIFIFWERISYFRLQFVPFHLMNYFVCSTNSENSWCSTQREMRKIFRKANLRILVRLTYLSCIMRSQFIFCFAFVEKRLKKQVLFWIHNESVQTFLDPIKRLPVTGSILIIIQYFEQNINKPI